MSKAPAFQFYAGDRAMELMGMDNEATGAWTRAMMYLWTAGPTPEERLQHVAGKGWERVRFLFGSFEGGLSLEWMEELRERQRIFRDNAAKNGAKGGRPSKAKKGTLTQPKPKPNPKQRVGSMKIEGEDSEKKEPAHEPVQTEIMIWPTFDDFWQAYERKGSRKLTEAEWRKLSQKDREAVMANVGAYVGSRPDKTYRKDGERYLKHRAWEDEIPTSASNYKPQNHADLATGVQEILRAKFGQ